MIISYVPAPSFPVNTSDFCSSTVYVISFPSLYFGKFSNIAFQLSASPVSSIVPSNSIVFTTFPSSSFRSNLTDVGLLPSWLSLSSQVLVASTLIFSGLVFLLVYST